MTLRWLVIYMTEDGPASKIIIDGECKFPFGVSDDMVADDCERIMAIVSLPDDYVPGNVVMDDREVDLHLPEEDDDEVS